MDRPERAQDFFRDSIGRLHAWATNELAKMPSARQKYPSLQSEVGYRAEVKALQDVVAQFKDLGGQLTYVLEHSNDPREMLLYIQRVRDYFIRFDQTDIHGSADSNTSDGARAQVYHEAQKNMEFIFIEYYKYYD